MNALDKQLIETEHVKTGNWVKLISILKHQFNEWATAALAKEGFDDFKMVYMPVLMNISPEGSNNTELASHARVTKQAMSKVAQELQKLGYIKAKADPRDKRSTTITLTDRGKRLVIKVRLSICSLTEEYRGMFKAADFDKATEILKKIIEYNDQELLHRK
ncbi:DNA-binding transcriptional regulator, MarR family [Chryseolinea serpens]|uniref:DNA-binding transcriptional regulator, MarR family n=1 Tax=Chryseolinea serpens TaxID=947013 RepID=A0A1M5M5U7_9BACT|nr:MarR family transcriptional regulator [Chryseolinea serpens]SHG72636.1 DNA-binding transcriptional regulator, MarR family [Chryseolinea serpens]